MNCKHKNTEISLPENKRVYAPNPNPTIDTKPIQTEPIQTEPINEPIDILQYNFDPKPSPYELLVDEIVSKDEFSNIELINILARIEFIKANDRLTQAEMHSLAKIKKNCLAELANY
jgi:hypothetical protein